VSARCNRGCSPAPCLATISRGPFGSNIRDVHITARERAGRTEW
jgi:hypothetical protein